jgi:hypothetical protein
MMEINCRAYYTRLAEESPAKFQIFADCEDDPLIEALSVRSQRVVQVDVSTGCAQSQILTFFLAMLS